MSDPIELTEEPETPSEQRALRDWLRFQLKSADARSRIMGYVTLIWLIALVLLVGWVIFRGRDDLRESITEIRAADPLWIAVAVVIQALMLVFSGLTYKSILNRLGYKLPLMGLINAHLQRMAISTVTPGGGPASVFVLTRYLQQRGVPFEDGFLTVAVRSIGVTITFIVVLIPGAWIGDSLAGYLIAIALTAALIVGGYALWRGEQDDWQTPARWSERLPDWLGSRLRSFITSFRDHGLEPDDLIPTIFYNMLIRFTIVGVLYACLKALGADPSVETLLNTYFVSILASTAIPLFGGAGAVEAVAVLSLQQAGIAGPIAIGATLLWRFIDLWIPVGIGLLLHAGHELPRLSFWRDRSNGSG